MDYRIIVVRLLRQFCTGNIMHISNYLNTERSQWCSVALRRRMRACRTFVTRCFINKGFMGEVLLLIVVREVKRVCGQVEISCSFLCSIQTKNKTNTFSIPEWESMQKCIGSYYNYGFSLI